MFNKTYLTVKRTIMWWSGWKG